MSKGKKRLIGAGILLFNLYLIGRYNIEGIPALLLTLGVAAGWEFFVVKEKVTGEDA